MPKISVIVPVYNSEKYLNRCIDSILVQTFTDFELILVDDGSSDSSKEICDTYLNKDKRVKVYHQHNSGASSARNTGLVHAQGDFISFIDADDYVDPYYLSGFIGYLGKDDEIDIIIQGRINIKNDTKRMISVSKECILDLKNIHSFDDFNLNRFCGPCYKLISSKLLRNNNIKFSEDIIFGEDFDFFLRYLIHARHCVLSTQNHYFYESHEGSVSNRIYPYDKELTGLIKISHSLEIFYKKFKTESISNQIKLAIGVLAARLLSSIYYYNDSKIKRMEKLKSIKSIYIDYYLKFHPTNTPFLKITKFLLKHKLYFISDTLLNYAINRSF